MGDRIRWIYYTTFWIHLKWLGLDLTCNSVWLDLTWLAVWCDLTWLVSGPNNVMWLDLDLKQMTWDLTWTCKIWLAATSGLYPDFIVLLPQFVRAWSKIPKFIKSGQIANYSPIMPCMSSTLFRPLGPMTIIALWAEASHMYFFIQWGILCTMFGP